MFGITINKQELNRDLTKSKNIGLIIVKSTGITAKTLWLIGQETAKLISNEIKSNQSLKQIK